MNDWLSSLVSAPEDMAHFQRERVMLEARELICTLMEEQGITKAELANRLGKSKPYVTQLLAGRVNMTLGTLSDVLSSLGMSLRLVGRPLSVSSPNLHVIEVHSIGESLDFEVEEEFDEYNYFVKFESPVEHYSGAGDERKTAI